MNASAGEGVQILDPIANGPAELYKRRTAAGDATLLKETSTAGQVRGRTTCIGVLCLRSVHVALWCMT